MNIVTLPVDRWSEFRAIRLRALEDSPQAFGATLATVLERPESFWRQRLQDVAEGRAWLVFAEDEDHLCGMAGGYQGDDEIGSDRAGIWGVFVDAEQRGNGVAAAMMSELIRRMAASGIRHIHLLVNPEQRYAVRLYERIGYKSTGTMVDSEGEPGEMELLLMELNLGHTQSGLD